jgi:hypothetical protein
MCRNFVQKLLPRETLNTIHHRIHIPATIIKDLIVSSLPNHPNKSQTHTREPHFDLLFRPLPMNCPYDASTSPGSTTMTPNHLLSAYQTAAANGQCKNKCRAVSGSLPHNGQRVVSKVIIPLLHKFTLVGILSNNNCHINALTLDGTTLIQMFLNTNWSKGDKILWANKVLCKYTYKVLCKCIFLNLLNN